MARLERHEINEHARLRVLRREDVVVKSALVKIHLRRVRFQREQLARELEHVVGVAGLTGIGAQMPRELVGREKMFVVAVSANDVGTAQRDGVPKSMCDGQKLRIASEFVFAGRADDFWNLRVRVDAVQLVFAARQRVENSGMVEGGGKL